jgi:hypothetical protein
MPAAARPDLLIKMGSEVHGANLAATTGDRVPNFDTATISLT